MDEGGRCCGAASPNAERLAVARGDEEAPPAMREWALKLEAKPKYVVSRTRTDFPWTQQPHPTSPATCAPACKKLKDANPAGCSVAGARDQRTGPLDLDRRVQFLVQPRIAGHQGSDPCTKERAAQHERAVLFELRPRREPLRNGTCRDALPARALTQSSPSRPGSPSEAVDIPTHRSTPAGSGGG